jgi:hypothetical protein
MDWRKIQHNAVKCSSYVILFYHCFRYEGHDISFEFFLTSFPLWTYCSVSSFTPILHQELSILPNNFKTNIILLTSLSFFRWPIFFFVLQFSFLCVSSYHLLSLFFPICISFFCLCVMCFTIFTSIISLFILFILFSLLYSCLYFLLVIFPLFIYLCFFFSLCWILYVFKLSLFHNFQFYKRLTDIRTSQITATNDRERITSVLTSSLVFSLSYNKRHAK